MFARRRSLLQSELQQQGALDQREIVVRDDSEHECAVGFVLDPDSDRLALIDEQGNCVS